MDIADKKKELERILCGFGNVAVAFSGGVDSTFLLKTAHDAMGDNVFAVMVKAVSFPEREISEAEDFCAKQGIRLCTVEVDLMGIEGFAANPPERCYICKKAIFAKIIETAKANGADYVVEGSNLDDVGDYRPGMRAIGELGVRSPLKDSGLTKADIRELSKELGLATWDKPSFACLATRIPYGEEITADKLWRVGKAEQLMLDLGFSQVRVRLCKNTARIELLSEEFPRILETGVRERINSEFKELGFAYTALDLAGYRTGSMNETLEGKNER